MLCLLCIHQITFIRTFADNAINSCPIKFISVCKAHHIHHVNIIMMHMKHWKKSILGLRGNLMPKLI